MCKVSVYRASFLLGLTLTFSHCGSLKLIEVPTQRCIASFCPKFRFLFLSMNDCWLIRYNIRALKEF